MWSSAQNQALQSQLAMQQQAGREHMESARHSAQNFLEQLYRNQHEASASQLAALRVFPQRVLKPPARPGLDNVGLP